MAIDIPAYVGELMPEAREGLDWVSYSSVAEWRKCPQAWHYRYLRDLRRVPSPDDLPVERDFGSWWHTLRAADAIARGRSLDSLRSCPESLGTTDDGPRFDTDPEHDLVEEVLVEAGVWFRRQSEEYREAFVTRIGEPLAERLDHLDARWRAQWSEEIAKEAPLGVEMKWVKQLPGLSTVVVGYIDEVYLDTKRNIVVVKDHKTSKTLSSQSVADDMMDSQLHLYSWGANEEVRKWGRKISAVAYDRARMKKPTTPVLTQSGNLSKSVTDFDLATYVEWCKGEDGSGQKWGEPDTYYQSGKSKGLPKFGTYEMEQAVVERLSTPAAASVWFQRTLTPLNPNLIRAHLQAAVDAAKGADTTRQQVAKRGEAPRNLTTYGCRWCDFAPLCRAQMMGGPKGSYPLADYGLMKRPSKPSNRRKKSQDEA